jgi:hypothetical protein
MNQRYFCCQVLQQIDLAHLPLHHAIAFQKPNLLQQENAVVGLLLNLSVDLVASVIEILPKNEERENVGSDRRVIIPCLND